MRQKVFPCCKKPMGLDEVFSMIEETGDNFGASSKCVSCPHCNNALTVFLNVDSVEVDE